MPTSDLHKSNLLGDSELMRHLEDKRTCPHCGEPLDEHGYLMSRSSEHLVLSPRTIAWIVAAVLALLLVANG